MKHTHVLYIITKLELGGAQKICLSLFNELPSRSIHTTLLSGNDGILAPTITAKENVILLPTLKREIGFSSIMSEIRCFIHMVRHIRTLKKKYPGLIVHTHSTKAGLLGRWAAWFAGVKKRVHTVHGFGFHPHQKKPAWLAVYATELLTSPITTHYVCVSSEDVKTGIKLLPGFAHKHSIIRAAVDWAPFSRIITPALLATDTMDPFIFGTVACFKPQKNLVDLLQAFAHAHEQNPAIRLEIVGDGYLRPALETWIKQHNLISCITLHGWQQSVAPIMQHWHAFALSSLWEGLPCAVVEARLLKLPILAYNTGGIRDVITHGENGLLYPQKDWQALARGMLMVSTDQKLYTKLHSYRDNLSDFKNSSMVTSHEKLYRWLAGKR